MHKVLACKDIVRLSGRAFQCPNSLSMIALVTATSFMLPSLVDQTFSLLMPVLITNRLSVTRYSVFGRLLSFEIGGTMTRARETAIKIMGKPNRDPNKV
jgi:hypothetical protein